MDHYPEELDVGAGLQVSIQNRRDCLQPLVGQINDGPKALKCAIGLENDDTNAMIRLD